MRNRRAHTPSSVAFEIGTLEVCQGSEREGTRFGVRLCVRVLQIPQQIWAAWGECAKGGELVNVEKSNGLRSDANI